MYGHGQQQNSGRMWYFNNSELVLHVLRNYHPDFYTNRNLNCQNNAECSHVQARFKAYSKFKAPRDTQHFCRLLLSKFGDPSLGSHQVWYSAACHPYFTSRIGIQRWLGKKRLFDLLLLQHERVLWHLCFSGHSL